MTPWEWAGRHTRCGACADTVGAEVTKAVPPTARARQFLVAILGRPGAALPPGPVAGDRLALLVIRSRSCPTGPAFVGTTQVTKLDDGVPRLRHRVNAPEGHAVPLRSFAPPLGVSTAWTDARLTALAGTCVRLTERELARVEEALLERAHEFGPPPKRPQHTRPRTPGRRALIAGRAAATGSRK